MLNLLRILDEYLIRREDKKFEFFEMSDLTPKKTGLPFVIFINSGGERSKHAARIKVVPGIKWKKGEDININIEGKPTIKGKNNLSPDEFAEIMKWVNLNRDTIMKYWHSEIDTETMLNRIVSIKD